MRRFLHVCALVLLACLTVQAQTTLFSDDFETGSYPDQTQPWGPWDFNSRYQDLKLNTDAAYAHNSARSMKIHYHLCGVPLNGPTVDQVTSGSQGARTYYVAVTYLTDTTEQGGTTGETTVSPDQTVSVSANKVVVVSGPPAHPNVTGWNVYIGTTSGGKTKQNTSTIAIGATWQEPDGGLISGVGMPATTTGCRAQNQGLDFYVMREEWTAEGFPNGVEHVFVRGYLYIKTPEPGGATNLPQRKLYYLMSAVTPPYGGGNDWSPVVGVEYNSGRLLWALYAGKHNTACVNPAGTVCLLRGGPTVVLDHWTSVEMEVQANTPGLSDGIANLWIDGSNIYSNNAVDWRTNCTTGLREFRVGDMADRTNSVPRFMPIDENRYWDDVVIADAYIGPTSAPEATPTPNSLSFNSTTVGNTSPDSPRVITLSNTGAETLNITSIAITGAHTEDFAINSTTCGATLVASASCTVNVSFTPLALGLHTAAVTFTDDAWDSPQNVSLSGTGTGAPPAPAVSLSVSAINFDARTVGTTSDAEQITLYNSGDGTLNIASIAASTTSAPTSPGDFAIDSTTCGATLAAAASCAVNVTFTPVAGGSRTGRVRFTTDAASSPDDVSTTGTGQIVLTLRGGTFRISKN